LNLRIGKLAPALKIIDGKKTLGTYPLARVRKAASSLNIVGSE
jgi:hypothetical protein